MGDRVTEDRATENRGTRNCEDGRPDHVRDAAESASAGPPPKDSATPGRMQIQRGCKSRRMQLRKAQLQKDANSGRMLMLREACSGRASIPEGCCP